LGGAGRGLGLQVPAFLGERLRFQALPRDTPAEGKGMGYSARLPSFCWGPWRQPLIVAGPVPCRAVAAAGEPEACSGQWDPCSCSVGTASCHLVHWLWQTARGRHPGTPFPGMPCKTGVVHGWGGGEVGRWGPAQGHLPRLRDLPGCHGRPDL
jgi:hypothetical protein